MKDFSKHIIEIKGENEFLFWKPNESYLKMYFIVRFGRIIIMGDCYDWIFNRNEPLSLLLSATDKEYFWSKVSNRKDEYSEEKTKKLLKEMWEEELEQLDEDLEEELIDELKEKLKKIEDMDLSTPEVAVSELEEANIHPAYECLVYTNPKNFDICWKGIEAFRRIYWETIGKKD